MDLSTRGNLHGVREVRGFVGSGAGDERFAVSPTLVVASEWANMTRASIDGTPDPEFWNFRGEASIVDRPYTVRDSFGEFEETITRGAFKKTLGENPLVVLNFMHDMGRPMATTRSSLRLGSNPNLEVGAKIPRSHPIAAMYMPLVECGDATDMSFAFRVTGQEWTPDYSQRTITEVSLARGDVAVITAGQGANPAAWGAVRSATAADRVKRVLATRATDTNIADLAELVCSAIDMADDAFDVFLAALGIPDPDAAEDAMEMESAFDTNEAREFMAHYAAVVLRGRD